LDFFQVRTDDRELGVFGFNDQDGAEWRALKALGPVLEINLAVRLQEHRVCP
jgi:hypothetical protein